MVRFNLLLEINVSEFGIKEQPTKFEETMTLKEIFDLFQVKGKCEDITVFIKSISPFQSPEKHTRTLIPGLTLEYAEHVYSMDMEGFIQS